MEHFIANRKTTAALYVLIPDDSQCKEQNSVVSCATTVLKVGYVHIHSYIWILSGIKHQKGTVIASEMKTQG